MLTPDQLRNVQIFSCLSAEDLGWLSRHAADVYVETGEYLIHEGEPTPFLVLIDGTAEVIKDSIGRLAVVAKLRTGDFFGELPILMATSAPASIRASAPCRLARLEPQELQELLRRSPECSARIMQTLNDRVQRVQAYMLHLPSSRVKIVGSRFDSHCREIRTFLSINRIPFQWSDTDRTASAALQVPHGERESPTVIVDETSCVAAPLTVRKVADALGLHTVPSRTKYDVVIVGGGPAGLAAAMYGASEGLHVLLVERKAPGGQAGTSSRIENYLGFPNGISGDDLSQRAFRQSVKFGAEVVLTREVQQVIPCAGSGYGILLDGGEKLEAKVAILATGVEWRRLEAEGVERFLGRGVLYGAARADAPTVAGRNIFIVGGGNSAGQAAMFFANYGNSVTMLIRGKALKTTMSQYLVGQIEANGKICVETETEVVSAGGADFLTEICTRSKTDGLRVCPADALFVMIGADAMTAWLPPEVERQKGYICTGSEVTDFKSWRSERLPFPLETNLPGLFCVGDVRYNSVKRVSSSVGEGSMAIAFVHQYLSSRESPDPPIAAAPSLT